MRTRLVYVLSFWLIGIAITSVLAMGAFTAWNLREGFSAYLQARDNERLAVFVDLAAKRFKQTSMQGLAPIEQPDMRGLLRELAVLDGIPQNTDGPPPGEKSGPPPPERPREGPPPRRDSGFGSRIALLKPDGTQWAGPRMSADLEGTVERPIIVDGMTIAIARLQPIARSSDASETRFLRTQYIGIAGVALTLVLLSLAAALWLARQWSRPLAEVQRATSRIARGELGVRVPLERTDEIGDVMRNVNIMAASLQRIEGARREWLATLSHELRTPLTRLRGEIEALVDGVRPLNALAVVSLREEVVRLGLLVDDLHLLAVSDLNGLPCHFTDSDVDSIVQGSLVRHERAATVAGLTLRSAQTAQPPVNVVWDASRIEQLLGNLLQNSFRYTDAPGVIEISWRAQANRVHIYVDDSAPGVAEGDLVKIFEPLYRADPARSRDNGGSGLGLAICNAIVEAHGGRISASRSPLGGLRIDVELPCVAGEND
jgi:two-component system sensor histidine kinase BaeS